MAKRISILALGSRGDVQPYVALGAALQAAGYRVRLATFESFRGLVLGAGLDFHAVPGDARALVGVAAQQGMNSRNPIQLMRSIQHSYGAIIADYIASFSSSDLADSDAILNQLPGGLFGHDLAEKLNIPHITVSVIPLLRTRAFPMPLLLARPVPGLPNRLTYFAAEQLFWGVFRRASSEFRARLGLKPAPLLFQPPDNPVLFGFSPTVVPRPPDWGTRVHVTGWWMLDEATWNPPQDLIAFLEAGPAPVFIGFGSMIAPNGLSLTNELLEAVRLSGQRAVLSRGWAGIGGMEHTDRVFVLDYAPYAWLFPRMAAVVHHGGSGTTGFALHSGVPSTVVPFTADQPFWGWRTAELGVGLPPIPVKGLSAARLADTMQRMTSDTAMRERAHALGAVLRAEAGTAQAVAVIQTLV